MTDTVRRTLHACMFLVLSGALLFVLSDSVVATRGTFVPPIDTHNRADVARSYGSNIGATTAFAPDWDGSAEHCDPGTTSGSFDEATVEAINWFRRMAGLPAVTLDTATSHGAREAALMMHAHQNLSHNPGTTWSCHTEAGAVSASRSNLTLGASGARGVVLQVEDAGEQNTALGHRRWLLSPTLTSVGVGNTSHASAIEVVGSTGVRSSVESWIAWPPAGYVPNDVVFARWSLSLNSIDGADFSSVTVTVTENDRPVAVNLLPLENGFADGTLGFEPQGIRPNRPGDTRYAVTVSGIVVDGRPVTHTYEVIAFNPSATASLPVASPYTCRGRAATIVGTNGHDTIRGTAADDVIVTLDGDDVVYGEGGNDVICAGNGNDIVFAGAGSDMVLGGPGADELHGGKGRDLLNGQSGPDRLNGNQGRDTLTGGPQRDVIAGNGGRDICVAESDRARSCETLR